MYQAVWVKAGKIYQAYWQEPVNECINFDFGGKQ